MPLNLIRRLVKGLPLTAAEHDGNLDKLEAAIEARPTQAAADAAYASAAQGDLADSAVQPADLGPFLTEVEASAQYAPIDATAVRVRQPVRNNSGASLAAGAAAYITGSSGELPTVAAADASSEATAARTLGVVEATIGNNTNGYVLTRGLLAGVNTSGLTEGAVVWLSETTGQLTTTRPTQPAHGVFMGICVKQGAGTSGILYVNVINGQELDELHDVLIVSPAAGQALVYGADGLWRNSNVAGGIAAYTHTQSTPATTWTINHNLGFRPSVELLDSGSQEIDADVSHPSVNQTVVTLKSAIAGLARLI